ncbi:MAG: DNA-3-methyladenine glycosylase [Candidatus Pacebacteria bacterium]|nr:DNA-3-methyladenine glycosylase [Candidatus Paceibacterota bacterium]
MTIQINKLTKLSNNFYRREVLKVARELLGKIFVRVYNGKKLAGKIVEVEAYDGSIDKAAHSFGGMTKRTEVMFGKGGLFYVYFTYGVHFCSNVVTGNKGEGSAVLLRGIEPIKNIDVMSHNRFNKNKLTEKEKRNLTSGPAKITQTFNIGKEENGTDLTKNKIYILDYENINDNDIVITKRIGITRSVDLPWRFYIKDNPYVSRK